MKKLSLLKKILFISVPTSALLITTPVVLSSCTVAGTPSWSTTNLPTGMTVEGTTATIQLSTEPFWTTNLTSNSTLTDLANSLLNFSDGLGSLILKYFNLPLGWFLDTSKGTYGVVLDAQPDNGSYGATVYFTSLLDSNNKGEARLVIKGINLG